MKYAFDPAHAMPELDSWRRRMQPQLFAHIKFHMSVRSEVAFKLSNHEARRLEAHQRQSLDAVCGKSRRKYIIIRHTSTCFCFMLERNHLTLNQKLLVYSYVGYIGFLQVCNRCAFYKIY